MSPLQHSFSSSTLLHSSALDGNLDGVRRALASGVSVNALDQEGTTALMCAVAGRGWKNIHTSNASFMTSERLDIIRMLLEHPEISLYTLNASQDAFQGVTPLGMASWLNRHDVVTTLLNGSTVSVDGMDAHSATALMYAARDNNMEIVQTLLRHGARPDFRDRNHRSSIQFSLEHPQVLFLCETVLRLHRHRESENRSKLFADGTRVLELSAHALPTSDFLTPPRLSVFQQEAISRATDLLVRCVVSSESSFLHSLLFSPALPVSSPPSLYPLSCPLLVNRPNSKGWSPIHYCASAERPSVDILDALYCAGADVALFTTVEHFTPLHCLARFVSIAEEDSDAIVQVYQFTAHLIHDLRAPLSSRDKNEETCLHLAAEHGNSISVLMMLLDCDTTGAVRELRNSRGLTPLEVAKPEFRSAFGKHAEKLRSVSVMSDHTIRPTSSFASLASFSEWRSGDQEISAEDVLSTDLEISTACLQLLANLRLTSPSLYHKIDSEHLAYLDIVLHESTQLADVILRHFRARARDVSKVLDGTACHSEDMMMLSDKISQLAQDAMSERGVQPLHRRYRDSEDSQATAVSRFSIDSYAPPSDSLLKNLASVAIQTVQSDADVSPHKRIGWADWLHGSGQTSPTKKSPGKGFKGWLKRNVFSERPPKSLSLVRDLDEVYCAVGREVKERISADVRPVKAVNPLSTETFCVANNVLQSSQFILEVTDRDLCSINASINSAKELVQKTNHWISRADRIISRALQSRQRMMTQLRQLASQEDDEDDDLFIRPKPQVGTPISSSPMFPTRHHLSPHPSLTSLTSASSSFLSTDEDVFAESDDDETRAIRRLILRKIDAGTDGVLDDLDMLNDWLCILKEVVRGVKRRAYL